MYQILKAREGKERNRRKGKNENIEWCKEWKTGRRTTKRWNNEEEKLRERRSELDVERKTKGGKVGNNEWITQVKKKKDVKGIF